MILLDVISIINSEALSPFFVLVNAGRPRV